jgi:hypothetical protein
LVFHRTNLQIQIVNLNFQIINFFTIKKHLRIELIPAVETGVALAYKQLAEGQILNVLLCQARCVGDEGATAEMVGVVEV